MNAKENKMATMPVTRLVINISLPLMISLLVQSLYNIVDGIYVARISEKALAATSLAYPIQLLMVAVSVGTGVGLNSCISRKIGAKLYDEVDSAATTGLVLSLVSSVFFMIVNLVFTEKFFALYTDDAELALMGNSYLRICMLLCQGIFVATLGERILQSTGNTVGSMIAQVTGAIVNVVLDPILIFGLLGAPEMGIEGAAAATVIGQWTAAILAVLLIVKKDEVHFSFRRLKWDWGIVFDIYKVGCPSMFVQATGSLMMMGVNNVLIGYSSAAVSFFGVYYKLQNFAFMPVSGLAQGLIPIVGFNYGAKNGERIMAAFRTAMIMALAIMAAATLIFLIMPVQLLGMYNATQEMLELGVPGLRILSAAFIPTAVILVIGYTFTGFGNGMVNMVSTMLRMLLPIPLVYGIVYVSVLGNVWHAFWIAALSAMGYCIVRMKGLYSREILKLRTDDKTAKAQGGETVLT